MKEWYTAQELAQAVLPELPGTVSAIIRRARKDGWRTQKREFGKGIEYHYTALPIEAQAALLARELPPPASAPLPAPPPPNPERVFDPLVKAEGDARAAQIQGKARARMDAKLALLDEFNGLTGQPLLAAIVRYNAGERAPDHPARSLYKEVSVPTIHRWRAQVQYFGLARVAGQYGNRKGTGLIDVQPQLAAALRGLLVETPHVRPGFAYEFLCARYQDSGVKLPRPATVARWLTNWKEENAELYCRLSDPDAWKSRYMLAWGDASAGIERLNQEWQFDSTPADLLLADGRHSLIGGIDVYSRRAALHVSKTSKSSAIAALVRRMLLAWGVPEKVKTDNGQDYTSHHLTRVFQALGIEHEKSAPFSPWQKPHIERFFRTFAHDLVEMLPGYIGHNVAEREQLRARQQFSDRLFVKNGTVELPGLNAEELQAFCDRWCAAYHARPHGGNDMAGQSPLVKIGAWRDPIRTIADERVLDLLLAPAPGDGWRTVSKDDGVKVDNYAYLAPALGKYARQRVRVLYDPEGDLGQVWCFDDKGGFIAVAECPELRGLDRQELAARTKALQQQHVQEAAKTARKEAKAINLKTAVEEVQTARDAAANTLVAFPGPTAPHTTPALAGAAAALRGEDALGPDGPTPELLKAIGYVAAEPEPAPVVPLRRTYHGEFERCMDIYLRALGGIEPDADDLFVLREFYRSAGVRSCRRLDDAVRLRIPDDQASAMKQRWLAAADSAALRQEVG